MKAALNGALNCSILDGWWDECFDGRNGWAITSAGDEPDLDRRDQLEAESVFELLESQIVPLFYDRGAGGCPGLGPPGQDAYASLGPRVTASRMVRDYVQEYYEPAASATDVALADHAAPDHGSRHRGARAPGACASRRDRGGRRAHYGDLGVRRISVDLGSLEPSDVAVQVLHGPVGAADEIPLPDVLTLTLVEVDDGGRARWEGLPLRAGRPLRLHRPRRPELSGPRHPRRARARHLGLIGPPPPS
jgi:starch phosphorylase